MQKLWIQAAMMLGGVLRGAVGGALGYLNTLLKSGFTTAMQFHQEGIAFARELGMNAKEAQAYTAVLTERTERLAMTYGVAAEQVKELQRNISVATSRQLMLNESQAEHFLQLNKLVGSSTVNQFTEQMMNGMGGSLDSVTGAVSKAYTTAAKRGLNAQKVSEKIASNLGMANRLSFRNGIEGLTRMAMQAEKMSMSLQSVESAAGQFLELDKAIENAAKMQMLGGSAAVSFGNPLTAAYEANYDPEAFAKRMQDSLASYATFDANKGVASVNGMNMDFVRNIASVMGISAEEATRMAKKNAEVRYKEGRVNTSAYSGMGLSKEQIDFLINKSNVKDGKVMFQPTKGEAVELSANGKIDPKVIEEMMKYEGMSDHDIMAENAKSLTSINEQLIGIKDSIIAMFAKFVQGMFPQMQVDIKNFGQWAKNNLEPTAKNIGVAARGVYDWFKENKETIKTIRSSIFGFIKFATEHWKLALLALGSLKFLKLLGNAGIIGGGGARGAASGAVSGMFTKMHQGSAHDIFRNVYKSTGRLKNQNWWTQTKAGARSAWKNTSNFAKGTAAFGVATGVIQGIGAISEYNRRKEEINNSNMSQTEKDKALEGIRTDRNSEVGGAVGASVGTLLGTFFFGPLGGMIGGAVGEFAGKFIGQYWDPIVDTVTSVFKKIGDGILWIGGKIWDGIKWIADNNPIGLIVKGIGKIFGKDWSITGAISSLFGGSEKHATGGVVGGNSFNGDKVLAGLNSGEAVITPKQFNTLFSMAESVIKQKPVVNEVLTSLNSGEAVITPKQFNMTELVIKSKLVGDNVLAGLNSGEAVIAPKQFNMAESVIKSKPIGDNVLASLNSGEVVITPKQFNMAESVIKQKPVVNEVLTSLNNGDAVITPKQFNMAESVIKSKPIGDKVLASLNSGESVITPKQSNMLFNTTEPVIKPKPVGEKEYIYIPKGNESSNINGSTITVKDFNINLSGTMKLDGGNNSKNVDMNALLNDYQFINNLKEMIKTSINQDMNGGRFLNDLAAMRGQTTSLSIIGR